MSYKNGQLANVTRDEVLEAIAECDELGMQAFLEKHGYRPSLRFQLRHLGRSYPSKAILGVAAGLKSSEFFGGAEHVVKHATRLGFQVREGKRVVTALGLLELARQANGEAAETFAMPNDLPTEPTSFFASGTNRTGEIKGMAAVGQDIGVAAPEIIGRAPAEAELHALAGTDVNVFVDSGAFSEVEFSAEGVTVVKPITDADWVKILGLYERLADSLHEQVFVVAPDMVGNQDVTLARLATYRDRLAAIVARGARLLVPVQKGALSQAAFAAQVDSVLAGIAWLPALPCKKAATSAAELGAFLAARPETKHVHLLGLGVTNREAPTYLAHVARAGCTVSMDANWIAANVGNAGNGRTKARRYTLAQHIAKRVLGAAQGLVAALRTAWRELALILSFGTTSVLCMEGAE
jgi:hypothetical protein